MNIIGVDVGNNLTKIYMLSNTGFNIIEGNSNRFIPTILSFNNKNKCRYFGENSIDHITSCNNTILKLESKIFDYTKEFIFDNC